MHLHVIFLTKHGGVIEPTLTGPQQYSQDLTQGGLELPGKELCLSHLKW